MYLLLVRLRLRLQWNSLIRGAGGRTLRLLAGAVLGVCVLGFVFVISYAVTAVMDEYRPDAVPALLSLLFTAVVMSVLFAEAGGIIHQLYLSSDLDLLLAAPLPLRSLFLLKLTEASSLGALVGLAGIAALAGYGQALDAPGSFYLIGLIVMAVMILSATAVSMTAIMLMMRVIPAGRMRGIITLLGGAVGALVWLGFQLTTVDRAGDASGRLGPAIERWRGGAGWTPMGWAADALSAIQSGDWQTAALNMTLLGGLAAALLSAAFLVFEQTFTTGQGRMQEVGGRRPGERRRGGAISPLLRPLPPPMRAVVVKEWRTLPRDTPFLSGLIFPLLMTGFFVFRSGGSVWPSAAEGRDTDAFWSSLLMLPLMMLTLAGALSLTAFGREGRSYTILHGAPVRTGQLLVSKFVAAFVPVAGAAWLLIVAIGVWRGAGVGQIAGAIAMAAWLAGGTVLSNIAAGALFPKFDADNPHRSVRTAGGWLAFLVSGLFMLTSGSLFAWLVLLVRDGLPSPLAMALVTLVLVALVLATTAVIAGMAYLAVQRLATWEEA
jgi:ABC-2 type transport system permease protein